MLTEKALSLERDIQYAGEQGAIDTAMALSDDLFVEVVNNCQPTQKEFSRLFTMDRQRNYVPFLSAKSMFAIMRKVGFWDDESNEGVLR